MPNTFFLYGATRSGKTKAMMSLRPAGRMLIADADGQVACEAPDGYELAMPAPLPPGATAEATQARIDERDRRIAASKEADVVIWPVLTTRDFHALLAALNAGVLGSFATVGVDSLTYTFNRLIDETCAVPIVRERRGEEVEQIDPVYAAMPDFSGDGVRRAMEKQDWGRYARMASGMVTGVMRVARRQGLNLVCTSLEEDRDIMDGEKFLCHRRGPLLHGRVSAETIPPTFQFFLRCQSAMPVLADGTVAAEAKPNFACWTVSRNGWPAGVRGEAFKNLDPWERNDLMALVKKAQG